MAVETILATWMILAATYYRKLLGRNALLDKMPGYGQCSLSRQLPVVLPLTFADRVGIGMADNRNFLPAITVANDAADT